MVIFLAIFAILFGGKLIVADWLWSGCILFWIGVIVLFAEFTHPRHTG